MSSLPHVIKSLAKSGRKFTMKTTIEITIENSKGETLVLTYEEGRQLYDSLKNLYS